ncbi:MAG TPA: hypothetical protein VGD41_16695 [Pyrinomonadaceae bacterium]
MKNQKFFFSVAAVLFVLGVFALFFFGFKSRFFAQVGTVNLVPEKVTVDNRVLVAHALGSHVIDGVGKVVKVQTVDLKAVKPVATDVRIVKAVGAQSYVYVVADSIVTVPNTIDVGRQVIVA